MTLGIMQPYFMPYIGYWQLMAAVDQYVVYDDVNYINRGWINRNNILVNENKQLFTISLHNASQNKLINEIEIADDFVKFRRTITMAYKKAPYFEQTMPLLDEICRYEDKNLANFIMHSFRVLTAYLGITTKLIPSSSIEKNNILKGQDKILDICRILNADTYVNAIGGLDLYDKATFKEHNIQLKFLRPIMVPYSQFKNTFVDGLSIIDVMMFNSVEQMRQLFNRYDYI